MKFTDVESYSRSPTSEQSHVSPAHPEIADAGTPEAMGISVTPLDCGDILQTSLDLRFTVDCAD